MTSFTFVRGAALGMIVGLALSGQTLEAASLDGGRLARRWCSACHAVSSAQKSASDAAPSFAEIARKRLTTSEIRAFLALPHPRMPDMALTQADVDALIAYIRSQAH